MRFLSSVGNNRNGIILIASWVIFLACSTGLFIYGYQCVEKYFQYPQAIDISTRHQNEFQLPSITFSGISSKISPGALNTKNLEVCGLKLDDVQNGVFLGSGSPQCEDPEQFWDFVSLTLNDFGFKSIEVEFSDGTSENVTLNENDTIWDRFICSAYYTCFTLTLPKQVKDVTNLKFKVSISRGMQIYIHTYGLLNAQKPSESAESGYYEVYPYSGTLLDVRYDQMEILDFQGVECYHEHHLSRFSHCIEKISDEIFKSNYGCLAPCGLNKSEICHNITRDEFKDMSRIYTKVYSSSLCRFPCKYHGNFGVTPHFQYRGYYTIRFKPLVRKLESKPSYSVIDLFAALSGYLGAFLGFSLFQLKDGFAYIIRKVIK